MLISRGTYTGTNSSDTGAEKKEICLRLGAEKWIDFKEAGDNLVQQVIAATDGKGANAALVTASNVCLNALNAYPCGHVEGA